MGAIPEAVATGVLRGHTRRSRLLLLGADLSPVDVFPDALLNDYSLTLSRERHIRRHASGAVVNADRAYTPTGPSAPLWSGRLVRLESGIEVGHDVEYVELATLILSDVDASTGSAAVEFSGNSRVALLDDTFPDAISFNAGTRLRDVVRTVCELAGMGTDDRMYALDDDGRELAAVVAFASVDRMLDSVIDVSFNHGLDFADDSHGRAWMAPLPVGPGEPVWTFGPGAGSTVVDVRATYSGPVRIYNRVTVRGLGPDLEPVEWVERVTNPLSPVYNPVDGSGPLGDRPYPPYFNAQIGTVDVARQVARAMLYQLQAYTVDLDAGSVVVPGLEDRDFVRLIATDRTGFDGIVQLDSVTIGKRGAMQFSGRVSRSPSA